MKLFFILCLFEIEAYESQALHTSPCALFPQDQGVVCWRWLNALDMHLLKGCLMLFERIMVHSGGHCCSQFHLWLRMAFVLLTTL